jgi:hypothetical protein
MKLISISSLCWACSHHATGVCDTWCDCGEAFKMREDVANEGGVYLSTKDYEKLLEYKYMYEDLCS